MITTSRQRVIVALEHNEPDRVPLACGCSGSGITDQVAENLKKHLGIQGNPIHWRRGHGDTIYDPVLMEYLKSDIRHLFLMDPVIVNGGVLWDENGNFTDEWGIFIEKTPLYYHWSRHPLEHSTISDLDSYPWPNLYSTRDYLHGVREMAGELSK